MMACGILLGSWKAWANLKHPMKCTGIADASMTYIARMPSKPTSGMNDKDVWNAIGAIHGEICKCKPSLNPHLRTQIAVATESECERQRGKWLSEWQWLLMNFLCHTTHILGSSFVHWLVPQHHTNDLMWFGLKGNVLSVANRESKLKHWNEKWNERNGVRNEIEIVAMRFGVCPMCLCICYTIVCLLRVLNFVSKLCLCFRNTHRIVVVMKSNFSLAISYVFVSFLSLMNALVGSTDTSVWNEQFDNK